MCVQWAHKSQEHIVQPGAVMVEDASAVEASVGLAADYLGKVRGDTQDRH